MVRNGDEVRFFSRGGVLLDAVGHAVASAPEMVSAPAPTWDGDRVDYGAAVEWLAMSRSSQYPS